jgi:hypothetical protein
MCMWQETLLEQFVKFGVNLTFFAPWLPWQRPSFWIVSTTQKLPHTTVDIPTKFHEVWWKESKKTKLNPSFLFPWQLRQSLSNRFRFFFGFSRATRCGCCSYQVSSISVRRVTCYVHFCVFQFFCILAVSMARQPFWKKSTLTGTTSHGIWYSYKVLSRHLGETY